MLQLYVRRLPYLEFPLTMCRMRLSQSLNAHVHSPIRLPVILFQRTLGLLPSLQDPQAMQMVSLLEHRRPESLILPERQTHLRSLKLVNLTTHHMRAQALLQKDQAARPETAMALQAQRPLVRPILYLKVN